MFTVEKKIVQELPPPKYMKIEYRCRVDLDKDSIVKLGKYSYGVLNVEHKKHTLIDCSCNTQESVTTVVHLFLIVEINK